MRNGGVDAKKISQSLKRAGRVNVRLIGAADPFLTSSEGLKGEVKYTPGAKRSL